MTDGFEELIGDVAKEIENDALIRIAQSALKAAHMSSIVYKEADGWGLPADICSGIAADVWRLIVWKLLGSPEGILAETSDDEA